MDENRTTVLLIEADADEASAIVDALSAVDENGGAFAVKCAARVAAGCRLLAHERFDAVLLDLAVPQSAPLEGFRKLSAQSPETPILVLTGRQDETQAAEAVREGAMDYLIKGTPECCLLKRAIRHAVERKRLTSELQRLLAGRQTVPPEELKRLEAETKENMRVVEAKNQFMARISHELRNTLATVKTAVFCLHESPSGQLTPQQQQLVEMIARNVDRQVKIIDNILDLSRFQSGKVKIDFREVELPRLLEEIAAEFRLKNKPQRLELALSESLPVVEGDPDLLLQVLRNLLENAFRFAASKVTLSADNGGPDVRVTVADDGAGIPQDRIGTLFNQFVQLERPAEGSGYKGTGLGLAICKEIIDGHHGRIWVESAAGRGARFTFALPSPDRGERKTGPKNAPLKPSQPLPQ